MLISDNLIHPHYQDKHHELKVLRDMTKEDLWRKDLTEFLEKLEEVERQEREDDAVALNKAKGGSAGKGGKGKLKAEVAPSPQGIRVAPRIAEELRTKVGFVAGTNNKLSIIVMNIYLTRLPRQRRPRRRRTRRPPPPLSRRRRSRRTSST